MSALTARRPHLDDRWEYQALLALTFPFFLAGALLRRAAAPQTRSMWRDARVRAAAVLPIAFHG